MLLKWAVCVRRERAGRGQDERCNVRDEENGWQERDKDKQERKRKAEVTDKYTDWWKNESMRQWLTGRKTGWRGRRDRQVPNLLSLSDKRPVSTKAWPSTVWSADKALQLWKGEDHCEAKSALNNTWPNIKGQLDLCVLWVDLQQSYHSNTSMKTLKTHQTIRLVLSDSLVDCIQYFFYPICVWYLDL